MCSRVFLVTLALLLVMCQTIHSAPTDREIGIALEKALDYLAREQNSDGSWNAGSANKSVAIAGMALMGFADSNDLARYKDNISSALNFLRACYHPSKATKSDKRAGLIHNDVIEPREGAGHLMYSHGIATIGLVEIYAKTEDKKLLSIIEDAISLIVKSQNTEYKPSSLRGPIDKNSLYHGGWRYSPESLDGDNSVTGWQVIALRAAKEIGVDIPTRTFEAAAEFTRRCYHPSSGGFTYTPRGSSHGCARTGMGVLSLQLCGYPDDPYVKTGIKYIFRNMPTWNREQYGFGYPFYYWYYATRAILLDGDEGNWRRWRDHIASMLLSHQSRDGSWEEAQEEDRFGRIYTTALGALTLELCIGNLPVYLRGSLIHTETESGFNLKSLIVFLLIPAIIILPLWWRDRSADKGA